jgi:hypothetical protein
MSFEMKYDRDGNPVKSAQTRQELEAASQSASSEVMAGQEQEEIAEQPEQQESSFAEASAQQEESAPEPIVEQPRTHKPTPQESFAELKKKAQRVERERDEALKRAQELESLYSSSSSKAKPSAPEEDDEIRLAPDELAEGKHLSKVNNKIKKLEQELESYKQKTATISVENRIKNQFPDFDKVVTPEAINTLKEAYPEIANTLNQSTDLYNTAVSAYTLIKKLDIYKDNSYDADKELVQKNAAKPRPVTSISPQQGNTPLTRANAFAQGLTDELKEQLRKEMSAARKGM